MNKLIDLGNGKARFEKFRPDFAPEYDSDRLDILCEDAEGNLWLGGTAFFLFDPETERFYRYVADAAKPDSLPVKSISTMEADPSGATWIGTWDGDLVKITPPYTRNGNYISGNTHFYSNDEDRPMDMVAWSITSIKRPSFNTETLLWIGTRGGGLYQLQGAKDKAGNYFER